jgi:hypothetical protein
MTLAAGGSARLIKETLDSVVAPAVRDALVAAALEESAYAEVPTDPEEFRRFVRGPLREALVNGLGPELGASIIDELERMAQLTEPSSSIKPARRASRSGAHRSSSPPPRRNTPTHRRSVPAKTKGTLPTGLTPPEMDSPASSKPRPEPVDPAAQTLPPPSPHDRRTPLAARGLTPPPFSAPSSGTQSRPGSGWGSDEYPAGAAGTIGMPGAGPDSAALAKGRPYVLIATSDTTLVRRLTPWLDATAELVLLSSVRELVKDLDALGDARIAVLIDCRKPSIRPTAVAALADDFPPNVTVVLWGASPEQERGVLAVSSAVNNWIVMHGDTRPKELAKRCADLVG